MPVDAEKLLCVVDVDLFVLGLNFFFFIIKLLHRNIFHNTT
jgi:hypothetical protein